MVDYITWLKDEFKAITPIGGVLLAFISGVQLALFLSNPITVLSVVTLLATLLGSSCTVYMMIGKPINGLLGLLSAFGFIYINWNAGHFASVLDQFIFIALIDIPLLLTWKTWGHRIAEGVKFLSAKRWVGTTIGMLAIWLGVMLPVYGILGDTNPFWDSLVLTIGATASWLVFKGYGDSYTLWLASNVVTLCLWASAFVQGYSDSSLAMLLTIAFYTVTAIYGRFISIWSGK